MIEYKRTGPAFHCHDVRTCILCPDRISRGDVVVPCGELKLAHLLCYLENVMRVVDVLQDELLMTVKVHRDLDGEVMHRACVVCNTLLAAAKKVLEKPDGSNHGRAELRAAIVVAER